MPLYESTFIARQDLSKQDATKLAETFAGIIEQGGGKVIRTEYWGLKSLAYKVDKHRKGHYIMLAIDAPAPAVKEMERAMRINEDIIRALTVRVEDLGDGPSVMMQQARGRDEVPAADTEASDEDAPAANEATN